MAEVKRLPNGKPFVRDGKSQWIYVEWQSVGDMYGIGTVRIRHLKEDGDLLCFWNIKFKK